MGTYRVIWCPFAGGSAPWGSRPNTADSRPAPWSCQPQPVAPCFWAGSGAAFSGGHFPVIGGIVRPRTCGLSRAEPLCHSFSATGGVREVPLGTFRLFHIIHLASERPRQPKSCRGEFTRLLCSYEQDKKAGRAREDRICFICTLNSAA